MKNVEAAARAMAKEIDLDEVYWGEFEGLSSRVLRAVGVDPQAEVAPRRFQVGDRVRATYVNPEYPKDKVIYEFEVVRTAEDKFFGRLPGHTYYYEHPDALAYELIEEAQ